MMVRQPISLLKPGILNSGTIQLFLGYIFDSILLPSHIYINSKFDCGKNIFEEKWDLLIVLDTCRPDALRSVSDEYGFLDKVHEYWSVGGDSWEWMANTFDRHYINEIQNTAYITSNPHSKTVLENQFRKNHNDKKIKRKKVQRLKKYGDFDLVPIKEFRKYHPTYFNLIEDGGFDKNQASWDLNMTMSDNKYPSPRSVTNHGIVIDRKYDFERIILHYMPPHFPYIAQQRKYESSEGFTSIKEISILENPRNYSWEAYLDNLRWGLNEVKLLLQNVDREKVVITADHGESFSKYLPYLHCSGSVNPKVRKVPWVVTTANDSNSYKPEIDERKYQHSADEIMEALGYK